MEEFTCFIPAECKEIPLAAIHGTAESMTEGQTIKKHGNLNIINDIISIRYATSLFE